MPNIKEFTQGLIKSKDQPFSTADFASAYFNKFGTANTPEELQQFTEARADIRKMTPTQPITNISQTSTPITTPIPTPTIQVPTQQTTPTNTLDSNQAGAFVDDIQKNLEQKQALLMQQQEALEKQRIAREAQINAEFERRRQAKEKEFGEEKKTQDVLQFRLGQEATPYEVAQDVELKAKQAEQLRLMDVERQELIDKANSAFSEGKFLLAKQLIDESDKAFERRQTLEQQQREQASKQIELDIKKAQEARAQSSFKIEQTEKVAKQIVPTLFNNLTDNAEENAKLIQEFARDYEVDPNILMGNILTYKSDKEQETILNNTKNLDMVSKQVSLLKELGQTGTVNIPGIGEMKIEATPAKGNFQLENNKGNFFVFNKDTGELKKADITRSDITPQNVSGFINQISSGKVPVNTQGTPTPQVKGGFDAFLDKFFDIHIKKQEETAGQSFSPQKREQMKEQFKPQALNAYNNLPPEQKSKYEDLKKPVSEKDISMYSPQTQMIINNLTTLEDVKGTFGTSVADKAKYRQIANEVLDARSKGLLSGVFSKEQDEYISSLNDKISKYEGYKKTLGMQTYTNNALTALAQRTGPSDIAAINQFQKVIDEGAVTRDQDVVLLVNKAQSLQNRISTKIDSLKKGKVLSDDLRNEMRQTITAIYNAQRKALLKDPYISSKIKELQRKKISEDETIISELGNF